MRLTLIPRASRRQPIEAAARPLPSEDTTPPVTKMYFADMSATSLYVFEICAGWARLSIAGSGPGSNGLTFREVVRLSRDPGRGGRYGIGFFGMPREIFLMRNSWRREEAAPEAVSIRAFVIVSPAPLRSLAG